MTIRTWPLDAVSGSPTYAGRGLRQTTVAPFTPMGDVARPLGALSGVRWGTLTTTVTATSTTWTCKPHVGIIDGESAAEAGPYAYSVDANVTGAMTAADGTNARVDILYVRISDPAESDGSTTPQAEVLYLAGTASGTPTAPTAPARSFVLAQLNVPKSGGGSPTATWVAPWLSGWGVGFQTLAQLTAWTTAAPGQHAAVLADVTAASIGDYVYNGTAWVGLNLDTGWVTQPPTAGITYSTGTGTLSLAARLKNGIVYLRGDVTKTSNFGNGDTVCTLSSMFRPAGPLRRSVPLLTTGAASILVNSNGTVQVLGAQSVSAISFSCEYPID